MFTSTMTDAEIRQEARKDFFELSGKIRMAIERFGRRHANLSVKGGLQINDVPRSLLPRTVEQRQWPTRRRNVWRTYFCFDRLPGTEGEMVCQYFIYIPVYRATGTEYIFLNSLDRLFVERFTMHFVERYKERHLVPRGIDIGAMPVPLYFQLKNPESFPGTYYKCADVGVRDGQHNKFWIARQGIYVTDYIEDMLTYITFMDKESLSPLKEQVYEEEKVWHLTQIICNEKLASSERHRAVTALVSIPNYGEIVHRFARRNVEDTGDGSKQAMLRNLKAMWRQLKPDIKNAMDEGDRRDREILRRYHTTDYLFLEQLRTELDIKPYHLPPGVRQEDAASED